jgi:hypothetical protein
VLAKNQLDDVVGPCHNHAPHKKFLVSAASDFATVFSKNCINFQKGEHNDA